MDEGTTDGRATLRLALWAWASLMFAVCMWIAINFLELAQGQEFLIVYVPVFLVAPGLAIAALVSGWRGRRDSTNVGARRLGVALGMAVVLIVGLFFAGLVLFFFGTDHYF